MIFKYYDSTTCSIELEADSIADRELLQSIYLKFIQNPQEVSDILRGVLND